MSFAKTDFVHLCLDQLLQYIHMLMEILNMKILMMLCKCILVLQTYNIQYTQSKTHMYKNLVIYIIFLNCKDSKQTCTEKNL